MTSTDSHADFWKWFESNLDRFDRFEDDQGRLMDELSQRLGEIDENLVYEISSDQSGMRELVISADGVKDSFPSVVALTQSAPELPGWEVIAFRPRVDVGRFTLDYDGRQLAASDFYFWLQPDGEHIDLILYVPGLVDENRDQLINPCFILLDMSIGEYDVATKIRYIDFHPLPTNPQREGLKPLTELPAAFDEMYGRVAGARDGD